MKKRKKFEQSSYRPKKELPITPFIIGVNVFIFAVICLIIFLCFKLITVGDTENGEQTTRATLPPSTLTSKSAPTGTTRATLPNEVSETPDPAAESMTKAKSTKPKTSAKTTTKATEKPAENADNNEPPLDDNAENAE
ncbi:MAG: hypothetical protein LBN42_05010 [Oscillospiraceae bacterium]|jgi:cytoskeletal protein RodZ|nr:hypothetical protein [Oscillospiraceae bacterium]